MYVYRYNIIYLHTTPKNSMYGIFYLHLIHVYGKFVRKKTFRPMDPKIKKGNGQKSAGRIPVWKSSVIWSQGWSRWTAWWKKSCDFELKSSATAAFFTAQHAIIGKNHTSKWSAQWWNRNPSRMVLCIEVFFFHLLHDVLLAEWTNHTTSLAEHLWPRRRLPPSSRILTKSLGHAAMV